jgi:hypothetical protein
MDEAKRCRAHKPDGSQCGRARTPGSTVCAAHGASAPQVKAAAARRVQEQNARELARRSVADADLSAYADPIAALEFAVSCSYAMAERLAGLAGSIPDDQLVWRNKSGEHVRGELTAAQKSLADLRAAAADALKIGLDARRAGIQEQTADMLLRAFDAGLTASGAGVEGRAKAREVFRRNLKVVPGEPA